MSSSLMDACRSQEILSADDRAVIDLAVLHTRYMPDAMDASTARAMLRMPGTFACVSRCAAERVVGFILWRVAADEAEILSIAVEAASRQRGHARRLLRMAQLAAAAKNAQTMFLEVAEDNAAARALYHALGFSMVGRRPGYYARANQCAVDALILSLSLGSAQADP